MSRKPKQTSATPGTGKSIGRKLIETFSKKYKVDFPTGEKVLWTSRVLHSICTSKIGPDFALMGGSAIVFLYKAMYRFSTDLDLDFIGNKDIGKKGKSEIEERQKSDKDTLSAIADDLGLRLKKLKQEDERFVQYELFYRSYYTRSGVVEIDMSYRYCHSVLGIVDHQWPIFFSDILPHFNVQSLKEEELYASKVLKLTVTNGLKPDISCFFMFSPT